MVAAFNQDMANQSVIEAYQQFLSYWQDLCLQAQPDTPASNMTLSDDSLSIRERNFRRDLNENVRRMATEYAGIFGEDEEDAASMAAYRGYSHALTLVNGIVADVASTTTQEKVFSWKSGHPESSVYNQVEGEIHDKLEEARAALTQLCEADMEPDQADVTVEVFETCVTELLVEVKQYSLQRGQVLVAEPVL